MKPSTKKAIDETTALMKEAGHTLTEAGFKYHSERLWLAVTTAGNIVGLQIDKDGNPSPALFKQVVELPHDKPTKKGKKKDGG